MPDIYRPSPLMPAGFGMAPMAWDPLAGGGLNFDAWPELVDALVLLTPVIVTAADLEVFEGGCADLVVPCDRWKITLPRETRSLTMRSS